MTTLTLTARGDAPVELAWRRYAEPALWPTWSPQIRRVEVDATRIAPGVTGRVIGPLGVAVTFVVDTVDELDRSWEWTVRLGVLTLHLHHEVRVDARGSATRLRMRGPLPVLAGYAPVARYALGRLVTR